MLNNVVKHRQKNKMSIFYSGPNTLMGYTYAQRYRKTNFYYFKPYSRENELCQVRDSPFRIRRRCSMTPGLEPIFEHPDEDEAEAMKVEETKTPAYKPIFKRLYKDEDGSMIHITSKNLESGPQQHIKKTSSNHCVGNYQRMKVEGTEINCAGFPLHPYVCSEGSYPVWSTAS